MEDQKIHLDPENQDEMISESGDGVLWRDAIEEMAGFLYWYTEDLMHQKPISMEVVEQIRKNLDTLNSVRG